MAPKRCIVLLVMRVFWQREASDILLIKFNRTKICVLLAFLVPVVLLFL